MFPKYSFIELLRQNMPTNVDLDFIPAIDISVPADSPKSVVLKTRGLKGELINLLVFAALNDERVEGVLLGASLILRDKELRKSWEFEMGKRGVEWTRFEKQAE